MPNSNSTVSVPSSVPAEVADPGKVCLGMGFKIQPPTKPPAATLDSGKVRTGMGFKILAPGARVAR